MRMRECSEIVEEPLLTSLLVMVLPAFRPLLKQRPRAALVKLFVARGLVHGVAVMLWFYAMARVPIAEVTAE